MGEPRKGGLLVPAAVVLIVGVVVADVARRAVFGSDARSPAVTGAPAPAEPPPGSAMAGQSGPVVDAVPGLEAQRARSRARIVEEGNRTYLPATLLVTDSALRRWPDERVARPLRVAVTRQHVDGFREEFVSNVNWAVSRWNGVVPVGLVPAADSATADIVVTWAARLDSNRTGRTDLTWDRRGNIHQALIVLATHTPEGQALDSPRISALALHELGHALGLGHSDARDDALYPIATAMELSPRDRRTAQLLYQLPPGSLR